jgi:GT2 family glycosyltransferase
VSPDWRYYGGNVQALVDLVAVAYQAPQETEQFMMSLANVDVPFTLCVVDNNSPNPKVREILENCIKDVRNLDMCLEAALVLNGTNEGYARAVNYGMTLGEAPYVAALNCDVQFLIGQTYPIIQYFEDHADVGVIGPRTTDSDNRLTHAGIFSTYVGDRHRAWLHPDQSAYWDVRDVPTASGATYFARRRMWEELTACPYYQRVAPDALGAFLPTDHFYEETWCSYHARAHDWRVVYLGTVKMIHEWHRSSPEGSIPMLEAREYFRQACSAHGIGAA